MHSNHKRALAILALLGAGALAWSVWGQPELRGIAFPPSKITVPQQGVTFAMPDFGGRPLVDVRINGKGPYRFIIDTGAEMTVIGSELREELALPYRSGARANLDGNPMPLVFIEDLGIGEARIVGLTAFPMPLARLIKMEDAPKGVLSAMSFAGHLVTFDFPKRQLIIKPGEIPADSADTFEYAADRVIPTVPVRIGEKIIAVPVDSGAASGLTLPNRYLDSVPTESRRKGEKSIRTAVGEFPVTLATTSEAVSIGRYQLSREIQFSDTRGSNREPQGTVGYAILRAFVVTLDAKNHRIRLTGPGSAD